MKSIKNCSNCFLYLIDDKCKYSNIEKFLRIERQQSCPFWLKRKLKISLFVTEIIRKIAL